MKKIVAEILERMGNDRFNTADIAGAVQGNIIHGPKDAIIDRVSWIQEPLNREPFIPLRGKGLTGTIFAPGCGKGCKGGAGGQG